MVDKKVPFHCKLVVEHCSGHASIDMIIIPNYSQEQLCNQETMRNETSTSTSTVDSQYWLWQQKEKSETHCAQLILALAANEKHIDLGG